jgi:hypothetical protein
VYERTVPAAAPAPEAASRQDPGLARRPAAKTPAGKPAAKTPAGKPAATVLRKPAATVLRKPAAKTPARKPAAKAPRKPAAKTPRAATPRPEPGLVDLLASLGVPDHVLADLGEGEAYPTIVRAFAAQPRADGPAGTPGEVIAVVGDLTSALAVARDLCHLLGLDATRIVTASRSAAMDAHIADPAEAASRAERLRGGNTARVVVVDAPPTRRDGGWAHDVLDALAPDTILGVVDPTARSIDIAQHLARVGEVDAIAVHGAASTAEPASPLALDLPVLLLDGRPATPHAWAALLCERIYEGADDDR